MAKVTHVASADVHVVKAGIRNVTEGATPLRLILVQAVAGTVEDWPQLATRRQGELLVFVPDEAEALAHALLAAVRKAEAELREDDTPIDPVH